MGEPDDLFSVKRSNPVVVVHTHVEAVLAADGVVVSVVFEQPLDSLISHLGADLPDRLAFFSHVNHARVVLVVYHHAVIQSQPTPIGVVAPDPSYVATNEGIDDPVLQDGVVFEQPLIDGFDAVQQLVVLSSTDDSDVRNTQVMSELNRLGQLVDVVFVEYHTHGDVGEFAHLLDGGDDAFEDWTSGAAHQGCILGATSVEADGEVVDSSVHQIVVKGQASTSVGGECNPLDSLTLGVPDHLDQVGVNRRLASRKPDVLQPICCPQVDQVQDVFEGSMSFGARHAAVGTLEVAEARNEDLATLHVRLIACGSRSKIAQGVEPNVL